jgi:hypothetical protein
MPGTFDGRTAFASVLFPTPGAPSFLVQSGDFSAVSIVGSAVRLDFNAPIAPSEGCARLAVRGGAGVATITDWTNSYIEVETSNLAGVATELAFDLAVLQQTLGAAVVVPPSPPAPVPPPTANLIGWWKADGIPVLPNGADVTLWTDDSGTGNNFNANGGFSWPKYVASDPLLNNLPSVSFNGSNEFMFSTGAPIGMPVGNCAVTVYTVAYYTSAAYKTIWNWGTNDPAGNPGHSVGHTSNATVPHGVLVDCNGIGSVMLANPVGSPFVGAWAHDAGTNVQARPFFVNGATGPGVAPIADGPLDMTPAGNWGIRLAYFSSLYPAGHFQGSIAEVLVYNVAHDPATVAAVTDWLMTKWGIP